MATTGPKSFGGGFVSPDMYMSDNVHALDAAVQLPYSLVGLVHHLRR